MSTEIIITGGNRNKMKRPRRLSVRLFVINLLLSHSTSYGFSPTPRELTIFSKENTDKSRISRQVATRLSVSPEIIAGIAVAGFAGWLYIDGADDRARRRQREEENARYEEYMNERARKAYIEPKEFWSEDELVPYDGTQDEEGPILMAADGLVFNVYKGRNFYGPGGEYHMFAGRDATRLLARTRVEEETPEEAAKPLTLAERASLAAWIFTFKGKYEIVGKLKDFDPATTAM